MAIVINGSGTVTGLAVGGLPDGTVDDGTVASGIASSKLTGALPAISGASLTGFTDAQMPAGSVLQVVSMSTGTPQSSTSSTYADTAVTLNITPTLSTSKILALVNVTGCHKNGGAGSGAYLALQLMRDGVAKLIFESQGGYTASTAYTSFGACSGTLLDSPSTTSAVTYKVQMKDLANVGVVAINQSGSISTMTLMEIAV